MAEKMATLHNEHEKSAAEHEIGSDSTREQDIQRIPTVEVDNYHGLHTKTILVYLLAQGIVIITALLGPAVSQAAHYWGWKWFIVVLSSFGVIGSIVVARADTIGQAIAGEVIFGLAYGAQPLLFAIRSEILPRRVRPAAQAGLTITGALGAIVGVLGGAALTKTNPFGFRTFWYISTGIIAAATIICAVLYNPPPRPLQTQLTTREKLGRLDWVAYFLLAVGITFFVMGLSWGDNPYPWNDAHVVAPLVVGAVFLLPLGVHQTSIKKDGLINHRLFEKDRNFAICFFAMFIDGIIFWAGNNYYAFQMSVLYESDSFLSGLSYSITFMTGVISGFFIAWFSSKTKLLREPLVASFLMFTIFNILMATATLSSAHAIWGYPVFLGVGLGWSLTLLITVAQLSAPFDLIAITSGLLLAVRSLGGSIGLGIYTAIFSSSLSKHLGEDIVAAVLPLGLSPRYIAAFIGALAGQDNAALAQVPGVTPQIIGAGVGALKHAYLVSFRGIWITAAVFSFVTAIVCCFVVNPSKDLNMHVDAPLEKDE